jgi:hypothetical protein
MVRRKRARQTCAGRIAEYVENIAIFLAAKNQEIVVLRACEDSSLPSDASGSQLF